MKYILAAVVSLIASISHAKICVELAEAQQIAMDYLLQVEPGWNSNEVINLSMNLKEFDPVNDIQLHRSCYYGGEVEYGDCFSKTKIAYFTRIPRHHLDMDGTQRYLFVTCDGAPGIQNVFLY